MGSVKDLEVLVPATDERPGVGRFAFSDRYSVFDWGEMPDHIADKGASLCLIAAAFFERLEKEGWRTHYRGLVAGGRVVRLDELDAPVATMEVELYRVIRPLRTARGYDYAPLAGLAANALVPLEVIYRFTLPAGSSVFKRLATGQLTPADLGLEREPEPGTVLPRPFIDFSTKLEETDRYLSRAEALAVSGLDEARFAELEEKALALAELVAGTVRPFGLTNDDGKFEFALDGEGRVVVVDALGTPDECRFTVGGHPFSKELARVYYRRTAWYREVAAARERDPLGWKQTVRSRPEPLPPELASFIADIYRSLANAVTGREFFAGVPRPDELVDRFEHVRQRFLLDDARGEERR